MSKKDEALKLALEALEAKGDAWIVLERKAKAAIREALAEQPAQDNTYGYAKYLAEAMFKRHFASDEHYASGRVVWGVNDTVIGILTQIDNMVADMVRRPAQVDGDTIVQTFTGLPRRKLRDLLSGGWEVNGVCFQRTETDGTVRRGAATTGGMVLWWNAEQPAQQEPVLWQILNGVCHAGIRSTENLAKEAAAGMQKIHDLGGSLAAFHVRPLYTAPQAQPAQQEHFDHKAAANAALRDAQNRSYQVAKSTQPAQQEPVAWLKVIETPGGWGKFVEAKPHEKGANPVYTSPPASKPLTDEQILAANYPDGEENGPTIAAPDFELICFARQIEAKLREKNNG